MTEISKQRSLGALALMQIASGGSAGEFYRTKLGKTWVCT